MAKNIVIAGEQFEVAEPYSEGHTVNEAEARALNQLFGENIRNNLRKKVKDATEAGNLEEIRAEVNDYIKKYSFSLPGLATTKRPVDPVEREARRMARDKIKEALAARGQKMKEIDKESLEKAIDDLSAREDVMAAAKKIVRERSKASELDLAGIGI